MFKRPFLVATIAVLVIFLMEMSSFRIFQIISWILGHLILSPIGWIGIPIIVFFVIKHKNSKKKDKINLFNNALNDIEVKFNNGEISKADFDTRKEELLDNIIK